MGLKVGELFINLALKGSDTATKAIVGVKGVMKDLGSVSIETKAAILAALYGLEKFTGKAGERGMELKQFAQYSGLSAEKLQKLQYALDMSGVSAQDTEQSLLGLQNAMLKMQIGEGAPKGMQQLSKILGGNLDKNKLSDAFYMYQKIAEYLKKEKNLALANETASSFGLSPQMIQAMRTSNIDYNKVSSGKILSGGDINQLSKVNTQWRDFQNSLNIFGEKLVAKHGSKMIQDLNMITKNVLKLIDALLSLGDKLHVFEAMSGIISIVAKGVQGATNIVEAVKGFHPIAGALNAIRNNNKEAGQAFYGKDNKMQLSIDKMLTSRLNAPAPVSKTQHNNAHITVHNHGVKDAKDGAHHVKEAVKGAFYQIQSQNMVT